jgi:uncharacterized protein with HEPN domain
MLAKDLHCLESVIEAIDRILEYTSKYKNADEFNEDYRNFDATMMNFVIIGEMIGKLSKDFIHQNPGVEWQKIKGLRNIVAHDYLGIDAEEVWQIVKNNIPKLKTDILLILK